MENSEPKTEVIEAPVPLKSQIAFGFTGAGNALLSNLGLGSINLFYLKVTGIDPNLLSISWLLFAIWNAINDPLLGIIEDRTRTKIGRRIPYIRYGGIFYGISFILIWYPFTTNAELLFWNHLLMLFIFDTLFSMIGLITYSLPAEMALTAKERAKTILIAGIISIAGIVPSFLLPVIYLGDVPNVEGFRIAMIICACLAIVAITCSSYFLKENKYAMLEEPLGFMDSLKASLKSRPFLITVSAVFFMGIMEAIMTGYIVFIFDYVVYIDLTKWLTWLMAGILLLIVGFPFLQIDVLITKYGVKRMNLFGAFIGLCGFSLILIIGIIIQPTAVKKIDFTIVAVPFAFAILGFLSYMFLSSPLMGEVMDDDEIKTGKRRETSYAGMNALMTKPAISIGHALFLSIIQAFGYVNDVDPQTNMPPPPLIQPASVAMGVIIAYAAVPIGCLTMALLIMRHFPLDGPAWQEQKRKLQLVHEQKEREFLIHVKEKEKAINPNKK